MTTAEDMKAIVASELTNFTDSVLKDRSMCLLTEPIKKTFEWEYGDNELFDGWLIADLGERNVWAAYCEGGHGALGHPWGIVFRDSPEFGMDCGWYPSLQALLAEWFA